MEKAKKVFLCLAVVFNLLLPCQAVYAMDNITLPETEANLKDVSFHADVPSGFDEDIEIFLNGSPYYMTSQSGYEMTIPLPLETFSVRAILSDDITNSYITSCPENIDVAVDTDITMTVAEVQEQNEVDEQYNFNEFGKGNGLETIDPKLFDFSDGKEYGTLLITRQQYGAIKNADFRLVGENDIYDISLDRDFVGQAEVRLPEGSYYESGTISVELAPDADVPDNANFLWQHKDNPGNWGDYYNVTTGQTIEINDLILMVSLDGDVFEVNSKLLFSKTLGKNHESLAEKHRKEALESAFPEKYETSETETIAAAVPVEDEKPFPVIGALLCIVILLAVMGGVIVIIARRRQSKSKR